MNDTDALWAELLAEPAEWKCVPCDHLVPARIDRPVCPDCQTVMVLLGWDEPQPGDDEWPPIKTDTPQ